MRLKQSRLETYYHCKRTTEKDSEGNTSDKYGVPKAITGESWPASGKVQAELYGQRLPYIRNVRIDGEYKVKPDEKGRLHYILNNGIDIVERDGICLYTGKQHDPDYQIVSIRPYRFLRLEVEKR